MDAVDLYRNVRDKLCSGMDNQKMAAALLLAVEQTIRDRGLELSPTAYFATLMTLLSERSDGEQDEVASVIYLLSIALAKVPAPVLRQKFEDIASILLEVLQMHQDHAAITRHVVQCIAMVLMVQEVHVWSSQVPNNLLHILLVKIADERLKVRKTAQQCLFEILSTPPSTMAYHPASKTFSRFCSNLLRDFTVDHMATVEHCLDFLSRSWSLIATQQLDSLLKNIIVLAKTSKNAQLSVALYQCVEAFYSVADESAQQKQQLSAESMWKLFSEWLNTARPNIHDVSLLPLWLSSVKHGCSLLHTLDSDICAEKIGVIYERVFELLQHTPHSQQQTKLIHEALLTTLSSVIDVAVDEQSVKKALLAASVPREERTTYTPLESIISLTGRGLSLSYQSGWAVVLSCLSKLLLSLRSIHIDAPYVLMRSIMEVLSDDDIYGQNEHYPHPDLLHTLLGSAIRALGPRRFLTIFPLNIESGHPSRAWLLPLLQENIINGDLALFLNDLVPLSHRIAQRGQSLILEGRAVEGKMCAVVWRQIWDLLPGFASAPSDLKQYFEPVCKIIIPMMTVDNDERALAVCEALRNFVTKNKAIVKGNNNNGFKYTYGVEEAESNIGFLSGYSQHLFPPLFAKFVSLSIEIESKTGTSSNTSSTTTTLSPADLRVQILETIRCWISIADPHIINHFFETTIRRFIETEDPTTPDFSAKRHALLDLANAILASKRLCPESVGVLYQVISVGIREEEDGTLQKKCYKALNLMFSYAFGENGEGEGESVVDEELKERCEAIRRDFWTNLEFMSGLVRLVIEAPVTPAAKRDRLALLKHISDSLKWEPNENCEKLLGFIPMILSETILATKEVNEKCRNSAYELLIAIGVKLREIAEQSHGAAKIRQAIPSEDENMEGDEEESGEELVMNADLNEYFQMVVAGLAGQTPHMISATIHSLSRLIFEFCNPIDESCLQWDIVEQIIRTVILYSAETKNREVIKAAIGFIKVIVVACPQVLAAPEETMSDANEFNYLEKLVDALMKWTAEHRSHFKVACRHILERLIRKCGMERVEPLIPEEHKKLINNIRKRRERAKKKKQESSAKSNQSQTYDELMKDEESEIEDDQADDEDLPQMLQELVQSRPTKKKSGPVHLREMGADDEPADFLDRRVIGNVVTHGKQSAKKPASGIKKNNDMDFQSADDGRLVIKDLDAEEQETGDSDLQKRAKAAHANYMESIRSKDAVKRSADGKRVKFSNKRQRDDDGDEFAAAEEDEGEKQPFKKFTKKHKSAEKEREKAGIRTTGKEYRGKRGAGDIKREGKPDPYAYIPLSAKIVAKRNGHHKGVKVNKKLLDI